MLSTYSVLFQLGDAIQRRHVLRLLHKILPTVAPSDVVVSGQSLLLFLMEFAGHIFTLCTLLTKFCDNFLLIEYLSCTPHAAMAVMTDMNEFLVPSR